MKAVRAKFLSPQQYVYLTDDNTLQPFDFVQLPVMDKQTGQMVIQIGVVTEVLDEKQTQEELKHASAGGYQLKPCRRKKIKKEN